MKITSMHKLSIYTVLYYFEGTSFVFVLDQTRIYRKLGVSKTNLLS